MDQLKEEGAPEVCEGVLDIAHVEQEETKRAISERILGHQYLVLRRS